jgi:hypothetical protein
MEAIFDTGSGLVVLPVKDVNCGENNKNSAYRSVSCNPLINSDGYWTYYYPGMSSTYSTNQMAAFGAYE